MGREQRSFDWQLRSWIVRDTSVHADMVMVLQRRCCGFFWTPPAPGAQHLASMSCSKSQRKAMIREAPCISPNRFTMQGKFYSNPKLLETRASSSGAPKEPDNLEFRGLGFRGLGFVV